MPPTPAQTPLHRAVLCSPEAAALLMVHGADVRATTPAGDTPLTLAATVAESRGFSSVCVRMLLQRGADPAHRNVRGSTALHAAAAKCAPDVVRLLIEAGAPVLATDRDGNAPLHLAAGAVDTAGGNETRGLQAIRLLLLAGADPNQCNQQRATPLAMVSNPAAAAMLERALVGLLPAPLSRSSIRDMRGQLPSWAKAWDGAGATGGSSRAGWSVSGGGAETPGSSMKDGSTQHSSGTDAVAMAIAVATPQHSGERDCAFAVRARCQSSSHAETEEMEEDAAEQQDAEENTTDEPSMACTPPGAGGGALMRTSAPPAPDTPTQLQPAHPAGVVLLAARR